MTCYITLRVTISLDDGTPDPVGGDPLEDRMMNAAKEAVLASVDYTDSIGGVPHEMSEIATVEVDEAISVERSHV